MMDCAADPAGRPLVGLADVEGDRLAGRKPVGRALRIELGDLPELHQAAPVSRSQGLPRAHAADQIGKSLTGRAPRAG